MILNTLRLKRNRRQGTRFRLHFDFWQKNCNLFLDLVGNWKSLKFKMKRVGKCVRKYEFVHANFIIPRCIAVKCKNSSRMSIEKWGHSSKRADWRAREEKKGQPNGPIPEESRTWLTRSKRHSCDADSQSIMLLQWKTKHTSSYSHDIWFTNFNSSSVLYAFRLMSSTVCSLAQIRYFACVRKKKQWFIFTASDCNQFVQIKTKSIFRIWQE